MVIHDKESEVFMGNVGLRQGCLMSFWLFNLYGNEVTRQVNARIMSMGVGSEQNGH